MENKDDFASQMANAQTAFMEEGARNLSRLARLPQIWAKAQKVKKGCTPHDVVYEEDRVKLLRYKSDAPLKHKTPLIFVFAMVNRPYIFDLKEGKSIVRHFVDAGFDTYLIDWGYPTSADRHLTLGDHIEGYLRNCVDYVNERTEVERSSLIGYCMGGAMSSMFTALHQDMVENLILMAAGLDFSKREDLLSMWGGDPQIFDVDRFVDAFGNMPAELMQTGFLMLKPVANFIQKPLNFVENMDNDKFVDDFLTVENWLNDNVDVPGEVYRQYIKYLYQENRLVRGDMPIGKHTVDLKKITCPVLNLMAEKDDLVPPSMSMGFNDLVSSQDRKAIMFRSGHIGLAIGSRAQRELWPEVVGWLEERSQPR